MRRPRFLFLRWYLGLAGLVFVGTFNNIIRSLVVNVHENRFEQNSLPVLPEGSSLSETRRLVFLHVGKAGGETVKSSLRVACNSRRNPIRRRRCHASFQQESALSNHTIGYVHCDLEEPKNVCANATSFLFGLRNPIDRVVSWFHYLNPRNCVEMMNSPACRISQYTDGWQHDFFQCFSTVDEFAQSLSKTTTTSNCSRMALDAIQGTGPHAETNHLYYNLKFYADRSIRRYPHAEIMVLRTEFLWEDYRTVDRMLGGTPGVGYNDSVAFRHGGAGHNRTEAVQAGIRSLCCALKPELELYVELVNRAVNLDLDSAQQSIHALFSQCQIQSLADLCQ